jgi:hypothetical protein
MTEDSNKNKLKAVSNDLNIRQPGLRPLRQHSFGEKQKSFFHKFSVFLHWIEVLLAVLSLVYVFIGFIILLFEIPAATALIGSHGVKGSLEGILSDILLLVVGVELAIMLVRRTPESLVEVMFFVIARKMLIKTDNFYEILIGVIALAGLFAIRKFLEVKHPKSCIE